MASAIASRNTATQELPTDPEASPDALPPASGFAVIDEVSPESGPDTIPAPPWLEELPTDAPDSAAG
jgi:hypothetical protein